MNIASRIQNAIETSGIVVSEKVHSDIRNKDGLEIKSLGIQTLKGVEVPVGIYNITCPDESILDFTIDTGELVRPLSFGRSTLVAGILIIALLAFALYYVLPKIIDPPLEEQKSLLVLPFNNYLGTDTLDYFVAGMHDALITDIGKISALRVKSKTTANAIKNMNKSIPEIAEQLGVNTFIEGSVMCIGDSICYEAKIFDREENVLWVQDYKVERSQILSLYKKVTIDIANRINATLSPQEEKLLEVIRSVDPEAYDAYLRSKHRDFSLEPLSKRIEYVSLAIKSILIGHLSILNWHGSGLIINIWAMYRLLLPLQKFTRTLTKPLNWIRIFLGRIL